MSNVVAFPKSPDAIKAQALEHLAQEMRINFAIGCTAAQGIPTQSDLCDVLDRCAAIAKLVDDYMGVLRAYE